MAITDELKALIGTTTEPVIMEVERGAIRRYADAIDDPNPLFRDVEHARSSRYGEMICPPG
ncbi:MAG: MaoC family dehydratase, partial [Dehalococcoidia bacterium]